MTRARVLLIAGALLLGCSEDPDDGADARVPNDVEPQALDAGAADAAQLAPDGSGCEVVPTVVRACAAIDPEPEPLTTLDVSVRGVVVDVGREGPACQRGDMMGLDSHVQPLDEPWTFRVVDADTRQEVVVWVHVEGIEPPVRPGDVVAVQYAMASNPVSQSEGHLTVRAEDGALLLWTGEAKQAADLSVPDELSAEAGRTVCTISDSCGETAFGTLRVTVAGEMVEVGYGQRVDVGGYLVVHAGDEQAVLDSGTGNCADWDWYRTALLVVRR